MSRGRGRRLRDLFLAVAGVTALLVLVSRWAGRAGGTTGRGGVETEDGSQASQIAGAPDPADLSFYRALGPGARQGGTAPGAPPRETAPIAAREVPVPALTAPPAPDGRETFVVQVLATRDRVRARRVRDRLASRGFSASVISAPEGARAVYRVRIGPYRDRPGAESVVRRLRADHGLTPWILRQADR